MYNYYYTTHMLVEALSDGLRREVGPLGVSVSVIQPAFVESEIHGKAKGQKWKEELARNRKVWRKKG